MNRRDNNGNKWFLPVANSLMQLIRDCKKQGIGFEYTHHTLIELNKKLEQCVIDIQRAEKSRKIEIVEDIFRRHANFLNDDFITQNQIIE